MNLISRLLPASNVLLDLPASSKKRAFEQAGLLFENNQGVARAKVPSTACSPASGWAQPGWGTVTWISPKAEFTPTPVQTREDRADLVYAVKIRVVNEGGVLKIGMPGDVTFARAAADSARK